MAVLRGAPAAQRIAGCDGERVEACSPPLVGNSGSATARLTTVSASNCRKERWLGDIKQNMRRLRAADGRIAAKPR
jgi:hypothetical protein